eukprot:4329543-Pleurochrysis_carterae.AAC.1
MVPAGPPVHAASRLRARRTPAGPRIRRVSAMCPPVSAMSASLTGSSVRGAGAKACPGERPCYTAVLPLPRARAVPALRSCELALCPLTRAVVRPGSWHSCERSQRKLAGWLHPCTSDSISTPRASPIPADTSNCLSTRAL